MGSKVIDALLNDENVIDYCRNSSGISSQLCSVLLYPGRSKGRPSVGKP